MQTLCAGTYHGENKRDQKAFAAPKFSTLRLVVSESTLSAEGRWKRNLEAAGVKTIHLGFHVSETSRSALQPAFQRQNNASSKVMSYILIHPQEKRLNFTNVHRNVTQLKSSVC